MNAEREDDRSYRVKLLDIGYVSDSSILEFNYIYYRVEAQHKSEAIEKARALYMNGDKGESRDSLPILLKIFSVDED